MKALLEDYPSATPYALAAELRAVFGLLKRRLRDQGGQDGLTPSRSSRPSALARAEGVRQQSMAVVVAALVERGFVAGSADPADGRQTILALTPEARDWIAAGRAIRQDWLTRVIARELAPDEQREVARSLALLRRVAEA